MRTFKNMRISVAFLLLLTAFTALAKSATLADLAIDVPSTFKLQASHEEDSARDGVISRWQGPKESVLWLEYFASVPKSDGGPMVIAKEEPIEVAGQKITLIETEVFGGVTKKALVVYLRSGEAYYTIFSGHIPKKQFKDILKTVRLRKKD